jgi:bloom syndrome protein
MDIRVSSPGGKSKKVKAKPKTKKTAIGQTGVAAARADPFSTYVSSPIQTAAKRRQGRILNDQNNEPTSLHNNGYYRDTFVVDDDDDEDDGFEPVRIAGKKRATVARELGPPITTDLTMESLTPRHAMIVTSFVVNAKAASKSIMQQNKLRGQPFSDTVLRAMMIGFVTTKDEMLRIPGVKREMVEIYGDTFLRMSKNSRDLYREMKQESEDAEEAEEEEERPHDPNHRNVIDLVSDDEESDYGEDIDMEDDEVEEEIEGDDYEEEVQSGYFQPSSKSADVIAFNQKMRIQQKAAPLKPAKATKKAYSGGNSSKGKGIKRQRGKKRPSGGGGPGPARGGRRTGGGNGSGGGGGGAHFGGGIGMMPV